jgi:hypothetical protein
MNSVRITLLIKLAPTVFSRIPPDQEGNKINPLPRIQALRGDETKVAEKSYRARTMDTTALPHIRKDEDIQPFARPLNPDYLTNSLLSLELSPQVAE